MKNLLKLAIGGSAYACWKLLCPQRIAAAKDKLFASHNLSFLERQLVAFILVLTPKSTESATEYWASSAGNRFHANKDHRLTLQLVAADDFYRRPMLDRFAAVAADSLTPGATVVEVGCGAGGNLLYLRDSLGQRGLQFLGLDINSEVIASNQQNSAADLHFETRNCFSSDLRVPGDLGMISCAVLMYVQEADIVRFLQALARNHSGRIIFGLSEPVSDPDAVQTSTHNHLAFTHGYRRIFNGMNFRTLFEATVTEENKSSRIYHAVFELAR